MTSTTAGRGPRFANLDVLRGLAILGTLGTNIWSFTASTEDFELTPEQIALLERDPDAVEEIFGSYSTWGSLDSALSTLSNIATNGKFLALLSLLFGVGMAIQFEAAQRRGHRWPFRYQWRNLLLLLDGLIHYILVIEFDILMGYALTALLVAPLLLLRGWRLWAATIGFGALHLSIEIWRTVTGNAGVPWIYPLSPEAYSDEIVDTFDPSQIPTSYLDQVTSRIDGFWFGRQEVFVIAPPLSAFLFLLGVALWRSGIFGGGEEHRRLRRWLAFGGLGLGLPLTVLPTLPWLESSALAGYLLPLDRYTFAPLVALGYLGLGLIVMERRGGQSFIGRRFGEVGRMALSCYMLQNIIASVAFYKWGLELGPYGSVGTILAWFVISGILIVAANLWLRRFPQGPFETVWRKLADLPFDRAKGATPPPRPAVEPAGA
jgi:uncharacterized protein